MPEGKKIKKDGKNEMNDYLTALFITVSVIICFALGFVVGSFMNNRTIAALLAINSKLKAKLQELDPEKAEIIEINIKNDIDEDNIPKCGDF